LLRLFPGFVRPPVNQPHHRADSGLGVRRAVAPSARQTTRIRLPAPRSALRALEGPQRRSALADARRRSRNREQSRVLPD